jgi:predicted nuclease of predicted toxin-antitoxin system
LKFLADECCDTGLVISLRKDGHDVLYVTEKKAGAIDDDILSDAYEEKRILITEDKDFGELVYRLKKPTYGIVLVRIDVSEKHTKWLRLKKLIDNYSTRLKGHFTVVDTQKFRFRSLFLNSLPPDF